MSTKDVATTLIAALLLAFAGCAAPETARDAGRERATTTPTVPAVDPVALAAARIADAAARGGEVGPICREAARWVAGADLRYRIGIGDHEDLERALGRYDLLGCPMRVLSIVAFGVSETIFGAAAAAQPGRDT